MLEFISPLLHNVLLLVSVSCHINCLRSLSVSGLSLWAITCKRVVQGYSHDV